MNGIKVPRKLIEVALPLDDINAAAAREKSIRHGHPSTLHLWWARRPLAAARAVLFAQLVNDPGYEHSLGRGVNKEQAQLERDRLFGIIRELVKWENTNNAAVLQQAREEIWKSWRETCALNKGHPQAAELFNPEKLPAFHDPFAGGGSIPLEAQRLGLESYASDLNPVVVTINKAMIEIPPKFAGRPPVGPIPKADQQSGWMEDWSGAKGLAEDVRRYGTWMRAEAEQRIGHLYPPIEITAEMAKDRSDLTPLVGKKLTVIAWLWARTVKSPNPAYSHVAVPLASTFVLSSKAGKEAYVEPVVMGDSYRFTVKVGSAPESAENGTKAVGRGANFLCLLSGTPISGQYIKAEGQAGRMSARLMAIVAEGERGRAYLPPTPDMEMIAQQAQPTWKPDVEFFQQALGFRVGNYGLTKWSDLFTPRQLVALTTFSDLVQDAIAKVRADALSAGMADDGVGLDTGGTGATGLLAWQSIVADSKDLKLNLDQYQARQAAKSLEDAQSALRPMIRETWRWLLAPMQEVHPGKGVSEIHWESFPIEAKTPNITQEIERVLRDNELLMSEWAPIHLHNLLKRWFWKDEKNDIGALDVWQKTCCYLYLPRLKDDRVYQKTLAAGAASTDFFGLAYGHEDEKYIGFSFGQATTPLLDAALLLINPPVAATYADLLKAAEEAQRLKRTTRTAPSEASARRLSAEVREAAVGENAISSARPTLGKHQFYGTVELDAIKAKLTFAQIVDEVIEPFTTRHDVKVSISVEIRAESPTGFDEGVQREVKENCRVLKFKNGEFE